MADLDVELTAAKKLDLTMEAMYAAMQAAGAVAVEPGSNPSDDADPAPAMASTPTPSPRTPGGAALSLVDVLEMAKREFVAIGGCVMTDRPDLPLSAETSWTVDFSGVVSAIDDAIDQVVGAHRRTPRTVYVPSSVRSAFDAVPQEVRDRIKRTADRTEQLLEVISRPSVYSHRDWEAFWATLPAAFAAASKEPSAASPLAASPGSQAEPAAAPKPERQSDPQAQAPRPAEGAADSTHGEAV